ncbi:MAG: hypothetical protein ACYSTS_16565 [Planctomycetota bacterium]
MGRINKKHYFYVVLTILVITFFCGCGTIQVYTGDRLPKEKVAIIKQNGARPYYIEIEEIDGKSVDSVFRDFEILPGVHTLRIKVMGSFPGFERKEDVDTISFVAEASHVYRVVGWLDEQENAVIWVIDEETNVPVTLERKKGS